MGNGYIADDFIYEKQSDKRHKEYFHHEQNYPIRNDICSVAKQSV